MHCTPPASRVAPHAATNAQRRAASAARAAPPASHALRGTPLPATQPRLQRRRVAATLAVNSSLRAAALRWLRRLLDGDPAAVLAADPYAVTLTAPDATQQPSAPHLALSSFAAGCFWHVEAVFAATPGVVATEAGYTQGRVPQPSYGRVASGRSGHVEAVRVEYDPLVVSYEELLCVFWSCVTDPYDARGQGADRGPQYRPGIFWHTDAQRDAAQAFLQQRQTDERPLAVRLRPAAPFYRAEEQHQLYIAKGGLDPEPDVPFWMGAYID